ncbi:MAG: selenoneine biosynthesis selenosugar synthase SenB [Mariniblastus sp.]
MRFLIVTPAPEGSTKGNRITATRWASIIRSLGHHVSIEERFHFLKSRSTSSHANNSQPHFDVLVALHARKSAQSVSNFRSVFPNGRVVVAFTGTDIHLEKSNATRKHKSQIELSLALSDRVILLEPHSVRLLAASIKQKSVVIIQSSLPVKTKPMPLSSWFEVSVIGHLRTVKDPFRAAAAARLLPDDSRVRIVHFGAALTAAMETRAQREGQENPRYRWMGAVKHAEAKRRLARSRLTVLSSRSEGGPAVVSEAIVNDVPILASRMDATIGLLGDDYPGLFDFGDTRQLSQLIYRSETDPKFYKSLVAKCKERKKQFSPATERHAWESLIELLQDQ